MISERIKKLREERGMTQEEFAEFCGVSRLSILRYENGSSIPNRTASEKISKACSVTVDFVLGRSPEKDESPNQSALDQLGPNQRYIAENLPKLNEEQAKIFRALLEQMGIK